MAAEVAISINAEGNASLEFDKTAQAAQGAFDSLDAGAKRASESTKESASAVDIMGNAMQAASEKAMGLAGEALAPLEGVTRSVNSAMSAFAKEGVASLAEGFVGVGIAAVGLGKVGADLLTSTLQMSYATGLSVEETHKLSLMFEDTGANAQVLIRAGGILSNTMTQYADAVAKGNEPSLKARQLTDELGVAITDENGKLRDQGAVLEETLQKLGQMTDKHEAARIAFELFGSRMAGQLLPVIAQWNELSDKAAEQAAKLGGGMDDAQEKARAFHTNMTDLKVSVESLGLSALPLLTGALWLGARALEAWVFDVNQVKSGIDRLEGVFGIHKEHVVDYQTRLKELGEKEMPDVAHATTDVAAATAQYERTVESLHGRMDALQAGMHETHATMLTFDDSVKAAAASTNINKTAISDQIAVLTAQKTQIELSSREWELHTGKTKDNKAAIDAHKASVDGQVLAIDRQIEGLRTGSTNLDLHQHALERNSQSMPVLTGNVASFNLALAHEYQVLVDATREMGTSRQTAKEWGDVVGSAATKAANFNTELSGMVSALDKFKNVPTPELLALQAAQSRVNAEIADYQVQLDKTNRDDDDRMKTLRATSEAIGHQIDALVAHRTAMIDNGKAMDAFKMSADGVASSEVAALNAIQGAANAMAPAAATVASAAEVIKNTELQALHPDQSLFGPSSPQTMAVGSNIVQGFINGMDSKKDAVRIKTNEIAQEVIDNMNKKLEMHSPSAVMYTAGENTMQGYSNGIQMTYDNTVKPTLDKIGASVTSAAAGVANAVRKGWDDVAYAQGKGPSYADFEAGAGSPAAPGNSSSSSGSSPSSSSSGTGGGAGVAQIFTWPDGTRRLMPPPGYVWPGSSPTPTVPSYTPPAAPAPLPQPTGIGGSVSTPTATGDVVIHLQIPGMKEYVVRVVRDAKLGGGFYGVLQ